MTALEKKFFKCLDELVDIEDKRWIIEANTLGLDVALFIYKPIKLYYLNIYDLITKKRYISSVFRYKKHNKINFQNINILELIKEMQKQIFLST